MKHNHGTENFKRQNKGLGQSLLQKVKNQRWWCIHTILMSILYFSLTLCVLGLYTSTAPAESKVRIKDGEEWHYFKGTKQLPHKWHRLEFDDSSWDKGRLGLGYGNSRSRTYLRDMRGKYDRIHARRKFTVRNPSAVKKMTLSVSCDGPFKAYLNGIEVMNYTIVQGSSGNPNKARLTPEMLDLTGVAHELIRGDNVLAIECSNDDIDSTDFLFSPFFEIIQE